ncbi:MAG TPA: AsmA family protein [Candidatus Acidoferrum sp.]|nr:AsmA family protein [Candidatus Acidoferrum sp.]
MKRMRKLWNPALTIVVLLVALQICVSLLVRTHRMRAYLTSQLETAFGRPVEVRNFSVQLLPAPQLDAEQVTVGENPAFGYEYFLRADALSARLRWTGLLRGHFEFGTLSLTRPSLILVRNSQGRWNLEQWLPPAKEGSDAASSVYGPPPAIAPVNRLLKIKFDAGRVNFKNLDEKLPFALTEVSGSVDQVSPGRWQLRLEAQPWRSGVVLQSAGTVRVQGDIAGTSARLQPAQITVHWQEVSLADLFRLFRGRDYGMRGVFTLNGSLKSGTSDPGASVVTPPGQWTFSVEALAAQIHRWDLGERNDNPRLRFGVKGLWDVAAGIVRAEEVTIEGPRSNLRGEANYVTGPAPGFDAHVDSAGIQATDLLAWYRAFHPGVDDRVSAAQFFTGAMTIRGWPLEIERAGFSSNGGILRVPGLKDPVRIGSVRLERERSTLVSEPVRIAFGGTARDVLAPKKRRMATLMENAADVTFFQDLSAHTGSISIEGHVEKVEEALQAAAAFGRPLNHGWELAGNALAVLRWDWQNSYNGHWNGRILFHKAKLAVAGLNQPLAVQESTLNWHEGLRVADVTKVNGFGGSWSGSISERKLADGEDGPRWNFHLTTDRMNAAELDRWVGPRARPNWLQRLLSSLLGGSSPSPAASDLVRQMNAEGDLSIGQLTIEKLSFAGVRAVGTLRDLQLDVREADAQWAGGTVHAQLNASFAPRPKYDLTANLDRVNLAEIPASGQFTDRLAGLASGTLHVVTEGVGRDELLQTLAGRGELQLNSVQFRGWDVSASVADGAPHTGTSRWTTGEGTFTMRNRVVTVDSLKLESGLEQTSLQGKVSFARDADLTLETLVAGKRRGRTTRVNDSGRVLKIAGPLDGPRVSVEKVAARQPAD